MSAAHTPGPWLAGPTYSTSSHKVHDWRTPINAPQVSICSITQAGSRSIAETDANACLIAAAPELAERLEELLEYCDHLKGSPVYDRARNALAKAGA